MAFPEAMATLTRLVAQTEALAALGARLRDDVELDPAIAAALDGVVEELGIDPAALTPAERTMIGSFARAFLRQAVDLVDHPERPPGWANEDAGVVVPLGRGSASVAGAFACVPELDAALSRPDAVFLDVGAGVAALSVAVCRQWPGVRVVGLEPWPFALQHARETVRGFEDRVELRELRVEEMTDEAAFDVVWLATPFISPAAIPAALERTAAALKSGGIAIYGLFDGPPDPLSQRLIALRTTRYGGALVSEAEACALLDAAGFAETREVPRTWPAPVRLVLGTKA
ncbi:SAM-dependent methyltransferase [Solirubrobacter soli]|uniref:SAM-dependent methyltransferase n=1 Tax=Solirubrobacter soli TaxID=363832 RepID=UPI00042939D1|nr:class I SAM-dependent methyltransferase [Solirubrobacter soli]